MDFLLTEEQEILRDSIRNFSQKEIQPFVKESDEKGEWPEQLTKKLAEYENRDEEFVRNIYDSFKDQPNSALKGLMSPSSRIKGKISRDVDPGIQ